VTVARGGPRRVPCETSPVASVDRSPVYVAGFVALLVVTQAVAMGMQFASGYRPFGQAPTRVPLSWDMFATAISRCDVRWDPPLRTPLGPLARLRDTGQPIEWDIVYDNVSNYEAAAHYGCARGGRGTNVTLLCFTSEGETTRDAFRCR
jgi:hypothetical protein